MLERLVAYGFFWRNPRDIIKTLIHILSKFVETSNVNTTDPLSDFITLLFSVHTQWSIAHSMILEPCFVVYAYLAKKQLNCNQTKMPKMQCETETQLNIIVIQQKCELVVKVKYTALQLS